MTVTIDTPTVDMSGQPSFIHTARFRLFAIALIGIAVMSTARIIADNPDLTSSGTFGVGLRTAAPIALAGLSGLVAERSGTINIGLEGMMVMGTISKKMAPVLRDVYMQMAEPKWVLSMGACACTGGIFDIYSVLQGIDRVIPVDVYVPGCPPRPEQVIDGIMQIQQLAQNESLRRRYSKEYEDLLTKYKID